MSRGACVPWTTSRQGRAGAVPRRWPWALAALALAAPASPAFVYEGHEGALDGQAAPPPAPPPAAPSDHAPPPGPPGSPPPPPPAWRRAYQEGRRCSPRWGLLFPGLGAICRGSTAEGAALVGLGLAELATGTAVALRQDVTQPGAAVPLLAFADLFTASALEETLRLQRAAGLPYLPRETLPEAFSAPFRAEVLSRPEVWAGIVGAVALGLAYEQLVDGPLSSQSAFQRPVLFGRTVNTAPGYLAAGAIGVGLFSHVAVAEELAFRGVLQGTLVRATGEDAGWLWSSLVFGLFHASNALFLPEGQRLDYLVKGVPFITLVGGYLGWTYRRSGYGLSAPIAVHFWYDFLLEAVAFVLDPKNSPLSMVFAF